VKWTDLADYVGPTPNENPYAMEQVMGVVLHKQQGNEAGSIAWCKNPVSQVSAHFFVPYTGRPQQLVDTADKAWAQAAGNAHWLSIENEGYSGEFLTESQFEACAQLLARAHHEYGVSLVVTDDPAKGGLGWHGMGGDAWGGHPDCPGDQVKSQRAAIVLRAATILGMHQPATAPPFPGRALAYHPGVNQEHGTDVRTWQQRIHDRGWSITVDGWYGPQSQSICKKFQQDSTDHGWPLVVDGIVGPHTWAAAWERPVS
jgi:hypothetical protein